jgi:hypothetical protein
MRYLLCIIALTVLTGCDPVALGYNLGAQLTARAVLGVVEAVRGTPNTTTPEPMISESGHAADENLSGEADPQGCGESAATANDGVDGEP